MKDRFLKWWEENAGSYVVHVAIVTVLITMLAFGELIRALPEGVYVDDLVDATISKMIEGVRWFFDKVA